MYSKIEKYSYTHQNFDSKTFFKRIFNQKCSLNIKSLKISYKKNIYEIFLLKRKFVENFL